MHSAQQDFRKVFAMIKDFWFPASAQRRSGRKWFPLGGTMSGHKWFPLENKQLRFTPSSS